MTTRQGTPSLAAALSGVASPPHDGSAWLCDHHADTLRAEYALGEGGGFNVTLGAKTFYTVQVAEKGEKIHTGTLDVRDPGALRPPDHSPNEAEERRFDRGGYFFRRAAGRP